MTKNTIEFDVNTGNIKAYSYVQAQYLHHCDCGTKNKFYIEWPENLIAHSSITLDVKCPTCSQAVHLPKGEYYVENHILRLKHSQ